MKYGKKEMRIINHILFKIGVNFNKTNRTGGKISLHGSLIN